MRVRMSWLLSIHLRDGGWAHHVAEVVLVLGLSCTETGRKGVKLRPSVAECVLKITDVLELPLLPMPSAELKECVICLEEPRGHHRFLPCKHSLCCATCAKMLTTKSGSCPICSLHIAIIQEGNFYDTYQ